MEPFRIDLFESREAILYAAFFTNKYAGSIFTDPAGNGKRAVASRHALDEFLWKTGVTTALVIVFDMRTKDLL